MKNSRSMPHMPYLRTNDQGGTQIWYSNQPDNLNDYNTMDEDVSAAIEKLREIPHHELCPSQDDDRTSKSSIDRK